MSKPSLFEVLLLLLRPRWPLLFPVTGFWSHSQTSAQEMTHYSDYSTPVLATCTATGHSSCPPKRESVDRFHRIGRERWRSRYGQAARRGFYPGDPGPVREPPSIDPVPVTFLLSGGNHQSGA
jgi:hypothetical protein